MLSVAGWLAVVVVVGDGWALRWDQRFTFFFSPSTRSSCPVLLTEVLRLKIQQKPRYMVLMLRRRPRTGWVFLTAYDPKAAKEYLCRYVYVCICMYIYVCVEEAGTGHGQQGGRKGREEGTHDLAADLLTD